MGVKVDPREWLKLRGLVGHHVPVPSQTVAHRVTAAAHGASGASFASLPPELHAARHAPGAGHRARAALITLRHELPCCRDQLRRHQLRRHQLRRPQLRRPQLRRHQLRRHQLRRPQRRHQRPKEHVPKRPRRHRARRCTKKPQPGHRKEERFNGDCSEGPGYEVGEGATLP